MVEPWLGVELRHLTALAAVAEEQSFRGAADRLGYVQSAVSQRIAQLELAVGARLVERSRGRRQVTLTAAGEALVHHAVQVETQLRAARADLRALSGDPETTALRLGVSGGLATRVMPRALARFCQHTPGLPVALHEESCDSALFDLVEHGQLDAAFAELPLEPGPFEARRVMVDPLMLVVPADSLLVSSSAPLDLATIASHALVVDQSWRMFRLLESEFAAAGCSVDVRYRATSNGVVQALVGAKLGVAIMPRLAIDMDDPTTAALALDGTLPPRRLVCFWARERQQPPGLEQLLKSIDVVCTGLRTTWDGTAGGGDALRRVNRLGNGRRQGDDDAREAA